MSVWLLAVVVALFFEGAMLLVAPKSWQTLMAQLVTFPVERLRKIGLSLTIAALVLLFMARWLI
ncbi:DUF2065 family protein [Rappaport israeli]|uniref:DUF2065 family protein n=1 Tax=Rappaport israeli TaxID=1839807 RepID=UPI0011777CC8|nr:DUF2065 family protein [Rappaport israeli]